MKPVEVAPSRPTGGIGIVYAKDQPQYLQLPAWRDNDGIVVTRWRLTWRERIAALLGRDLYLRVMTFNSPLQPVRLHFSEPEAFDWDTDERRVTA